MRLIIFSLILVILLTPFAFADVIITQQPEELYNLGDTINIPIKIYANTEPITGKTLTTNLLCNGFDILSVNKQGVEDLNNGESAQKNIIIHIDRELLKERTGAIGCVLKSFLGTEEIEPTDEFKISDLINIDLQDQKIETAPEEEIIIEGSAIKENGEAVQGIIELKVIGDNQTIVEMLDTVKNGYFCLNFFFPKETKAGQHLVKINIYENDLNEKQTNKGFINYNLLVTQVPTNLEIVFETTDVEPGTALKVKTILHDQTGEPIDAISIITIKNQKNEILEQIEKQTSEFLEFPIMYNQAPAKWIVVAVSNQLTSETNFNITEKEDISIVLVNKTIVITNTGNVIYCNKTVLIKIGNESVNVNVCLGVDENQEYLLTAPEGEYEVKIISEGEETITKNIMLTGKTVDVKEISKKGFIRYPLVWIFIIAILGFITFMFFKKGYKKSFIGYLSKKRKSKAVPLEKGSLIETKNKAELSLSIKGDKQNVSLACLKVKNFREIKSQKGNAKETLQKAVDVAEEKKAAIYQNQDNIFFILAPVKTKTFKNEKTAMEIAQKIKEILTEHNRLFKQKIEFGISLNYGTIIAKQEKDVLKFMSMGTLITTAKKIASLAKDDILLGEKINDKLRADIRTEKQTHGKTDVFSIKEIRERGEHKTFLSNFIKRLERDKEKKEDKDKK